MSNALLRVSTDSAAHWTSVRQVNYVYYSVSGDSNGSINDLKTAVVEDGAGNPIYTMYYRYYTTSDIASSLPGFVHGLKYTVGPQGYARLLAANSVTDPSSLSNSLVAVYASKYFEYDSSRRVTKEITQA
jgi:hypothetical protein